MITDLDYYQALEVSKDANGDTIKSSFRRLAMKYHPDKNPGCKESEEKFKYLCEAYECLKDDQKRAAYDRYGHDSYKNQSSMGGGGGNPFGFDFGFGTGGFSDIFSEIFSEFMGGGSRGGASSPTRKGDDLQYSMRITLEEAFSGITKEINISKTKPCTKCNGYGTKNGKEPDRCTKCGGTGKIRMQRGFFVMEDICPSCRGNGHIIKESCTECHGNGYLNTHENLKVEVPAGVENGSRIRLTGAGNAGIRGGASGDLYIFVQIPDHKLYARQGAHLYAEVPVSFISTSLGDTIELPGVDGETLEVSIPEGSQYGSQIKLKGKGMPNLRSSTRGDLYISLNIQTPKKLTTRQKELLKEFKTLGEDEASKTFFTKIKDLFSKAS